MIYVRPVAQYALGTHVRNLNDFFNPVVTESEIKYEAVADDKFNTGNLNGFGVEAGVILRLPEL